MKPLIDKLTSDSLKSLKPYESARRLFAAGDSGQQQVWLNANESPFANPYDVDDARFNRYPDCQPTGVLKNYAEYSGINIQNTLVTRGADEGIELLIRAFCAPDKDNILICPPTYGMYAISAQTCNAGVLEAPLNADFSLDVPAICALKGKVNLVFICSPNNPTGTSVSTEQIQAVVEHFSDSALVVIDEAYIEFDWQNSWASKITQYDNLVVLRTLSKAFALAGLRCGFTLADEAIIQTMLKVIAPYPIPEPVAQIAQQALMPEGISLMRNQVNVLSIERAKMKNALQSIPSIEIVGDDKANFILFRCEQKASLMQYLVDNKVLIRDQSKQQQLNNCLRITIGDEQQNQRLIALINEFFLLLSQAQQEQAQ